MTAEEYELLLESLFIFFCCHKSFIHGGTSMADSSCHYFDSEKEDDETEEDKKCQGDHERQQSRTEVGVAVQHLDIRGQAVGGLSPSLDCLPSSPTGLGTFPLAPLAPLTRDLGYLNAVRFFPDCEVSVFPGESTPNKKNITFIIS